MRVFDPTSLWAVDEDLLDDMVTVFGLAALTRNLSGKARQPCWSELLTSDEATARGNSCPGRCRYTIVVSYTWMWTIRSMNALV
jgi:hypothetical protein